MFPAIALTRGTWSYMNAPSKETHELTSNMASKESHELMSNTASKESHTK